MAFERITVEVDKRDPQPCIRGLRIPVATVVAMVSDGMSSDEIVEELRDVAEALRYAAEAFESGPCRSPGPRAARVPSSPRSWCPGR